MAQQRQIEQLRQTLAEIQNIMNSMKTLAYLETRKLNGFLDAQRSVVTHIDTVARDFFCRPYLQANNFHAKGRHFLALFEFGRRGGADK